MSRYHRRYYTTSAVCHTDRDYFTLDARPAHSTLILLVAREGIEPPTRGFSARG